MARFQRVVWIVLDSVGIGEMPDAADYGDTGSDTLGNIARQRMLRLPNLVNLGLANIKSLAHLDRSRRRLERVVVGGAAIIVARGEYRLDG